VSPRHVAIIMDGNRRWASERGLPIGCGYRRGISALRETLRAASAARVRVVTAYAFSEENWERPAGEIGLLMRICARAARGELRRLVKEGVRVRLCGRTERLPSSTRAALESLVAETSHNRGILLNLAIDYGGRREIGDAVRTLVEEVRSGVREASSIDERALASRLYTAGLPDPDLIIRTGGELRLSNFLLFQSAYAEFWATPVYWPDFGESNFKAALDDFESRQRRYGT
jgi:undecaprenyl diphosphate synthase